MGFIFSGYLQYHSSRCPLFCGQVEKLSVDRKIRCQHLAEKSFWLNLKETHGLENMKGICIKKNLNYFRLPRCSLREPRPARRKYIPGPATYITRETLFKCLSVCKFKSILWRDYFLIHFEHHRAPFLPS